MPTTDTTAVMPVTLIVLTDTDTTTARGLLMPNLRLMPMLMLPLMPTTDTTAVDTDTVMAVMVLDTDTVDTVDTMAVDMDTVTDTDITVKLLLKQQIFKSHISSPIIELSIYQTRLPPPPYIHPEKSEKYLDQK